MDVIFGINPLIPLPLHRLQDAFKKDFKAPEDCASVKLYVAYLILLNHHLHHLPPLHPYLHLLPTENFQQDREVGIKLNGGGK